MPEGFRDFLDTRATRNAVFDRVEDAFKQRFPLDGSRVSLKATNVRVDRKDFSLDEQKKAILEGRDLSVPVKATMTLKDKSSGKTLGSKSMTIARVPYITGRGTMISKGVEYAPVSQFRLKPGVFTRIKSNGELESHFNVAPGTGKSFRLNMDPKSGVFRMNIGQANIKLLPVLKATGITSDELKREWGEDLYQANKAAATKDPTAVDKAYKRLLGRQAMPNLSDQEKGQEILRVFNKSQLDPEVTRQTLGKPLGSINQDTLIKSTNRLLNVFNKKEEPDDRDSLVFRTIHGVEDFLSEKVIKDSGRVSRKLMSKLDTKRDIEKLPAGYWTPQLKSLLTGDARALPLEEINPVELVDQQSRVIALGEGGIGSVRAVPEESHNVHPSQFGLVDPIRGPESEKIGVDVRVTHGALKGPNNKLFTKAFNVSKGRNVLVSPDVIARSVVAFPGEMNKKSGKIKAMVGGQIQKVPRSKVQYSLNSGADMFTVTSNLVPMMQSVQGNRLFMGGRAIPQALPLDEPDAPLVQSLVPGSTESFEDQLGQIIGTRKARVSGTVESVKPGMISVRDSDGKLHKHDLYNNFPLNRKTYLQHNPQVSAGDKVKSGGILASSNFTDDKGTLALGKNLKVGYMPYRGYNYEDGIVVSESAAKKLTSIHMHGFEQDKDDRTEVSRRKFIAKFPTKFKKSQFENIDEDGVVKPGTVVQPGDPLILGVRKKELTSSDAMLGKLHKALKTPFIPHSTDWDHHQEGMVTDVVKGKGGVRVFVKSKAELEVGDKLSGRHGNKGVVSKVLPDSQMPQTKDGNPLEVLLNPLGVVGRINPAQVYETNLGKVVEKTGQPYRLEAFKGGDMVKFTERELKKNGISDTEDLIDPLTGREIPQVMTGTQHMLKLHKTSGSGFSAREVARYTADMRPAKGGEEGSKKISNMELSALVGHGAKNNLREISALKGERNDELWRAIKLGQPLPSPKVPFVYDKFIASLKGAGINVTKTGEVSQVLPLIDSDIKKLSTGEVKNPRMLSARNLRPEKGGLFDPGITGGAQGTRWAHIKMPEPILNPVMEEPARRILGLTQKGLMDVVSGKTPMNGKYGGKALKAALQKVNVDEKIQEMQDIIKSGRKSLRDNAVKTLGYLKTLKENDLDPADMMINNVPVVPPVFRPVSVANTGVVVSDSNWLYRDLMHARDGFKSLKGELPDSELADERAHMYNAAKAVVGLTDPVSIKNKNKNLKGFVRQIVGGTPKAGLFQNKVLGKLQDVTGRAVVIPDPTLDMDQVGIPEDMAWKVFKPFAMRKLVTRGMPAVRADQEIEDRTPSAKKALEDVMGERPVLVNRAPTLHKFNVMALRPVMRNDRNIAMPAVIESGFNLDHDGDQMNLHVPVTDAAVHEAFDKMLPSRNLFSLKGRQAHYLPMQEATLGLYKATSKTKSGKVKKFATKADAIAAYRRGELDLSDPVEITQV